MHGFAADLYAFGVLLVMMLTGGEAMWTSFLLCLWRWVHWAVLCFYPRAMQKNNKKQHVSYRVCFYLCVHSHRCARLQSPIFHVSLSWAELVWSGVPWHKGGSLWTEADGTAWRGKLGSCSWRFLLHKRAGELKVESLSAFFNLFLLASPHCFHVNVTFLKSTSVACLSLRSAIQPITRLPPESLKELQDVLARQILRVHWGLNEGHLLGMLGEAWGNDRKDGEDNDHIIRHQKQCGKQKLLHRTVYTMYIFHCCDFYHCHYWVYQVSISINSCRSGWGTASSINLPHERWVDSVFVFQMFVNKLKKLISSIAPQYSSITVCWLCGVFELVESNKIQKDDRWSKYMSRMHVAWMGSSRTIPPKDDLQDLLGPFDGSTRTPVGLSAR